MADVNILGIFTDAEPARRAIDALHDAGFSDEQITVISHKVELAGTTTGGFQGFLSSLGMASDTTNVKQSLMNVGLTEDQSERIEHQIGDDGAVIAVHPGDRREEALDILNRFATVGVPGAMEERADIERHPGVETEEGRREIELHGEKLEVEKESEQVGEVIARKEVVTEQRTIEVPIRREEVVIERHPVPEGRQEVAPGDVEIREGEEIRIPVTEERVEVEKRPVVREEVTIGKRATEEEEQIQETLRKEKLRVEQEGQADVRSTGEVKRDD